MSELQLHEEEKGMLVDRVEDLTNKLYASEKSLRQLKERRLSRDGGCAAPLKLSIIIYFRIFLNSKSLMIIFRCNVNEVQGVPSGLGPGFC